MTYQICTGYDIDGICWIRLMDAKHLRAELVHVVAEDEGVDYAMEYGKRLEQYSERQLLDEAIEELELVEEHSFICTPATLQAAFTPL